MPARSQYDADFYAWANEQAALLRAGRLAEADISNIAEEIESMGKSEKRELVNRLSVVLLHLLKWRFQPALRGNSWRLSVAEQRILLDALMSDNPSLKSRIDEALVQAYKVARVMAERETGLSADLFPVDCPWTFAQALDAEFWPEMN